MHAVSMSATDNKQRSASRRPRVAATVTALATLVGGVLIGASTQHFASADVSSGNRPIVIPIEPCRLADTRPGTNQVGPRSVRLGAGDTHTVNAQQASTPCSGKIPADALALSLNVTALNASALSFLTIWAGGERPLAASLNPAPGQPPVPNAVVVDLSVDQTFDVYNDAGTVDVVIDVNGFYADHNHDDRYPTDAEVASQMSSAIAASEARTAEALAASDARTTEAIAASVVKQIQLPLTEAHYSTNSYYSLSSTRSGGRIPDGVSSASIGFSFVLPSNYTENSTFYFDMLWMIEEESCRVGIQRSGSTIARTGLPSRNGDIDDTNHQELSGGSKVVRSLRIPWVPTGSGARAGDAVHVSFYRTTDSCTADLIIQGLTVAYT